MDGVQEYIETQAASAEAEVTSLQDVYYELVAHLLGEHIINPRGNTDRNEPKNELKDIISGRVEQPKLKSRILELSAQELVELTCMLEREVCRLQGEKENALEGRKQEERRREGFAEFLVDLPYIHGRYTVAYAASFLANVCVGQHFPADYVRHNEQLESRIVRDLHHLGFTVPDATTDDLDMDFVARMEAAISTSISEKKLTVTRRTNMEDYAVRDPEMGAIAGDWKTIIGAMQKKAKSCGSLSRNGVDDFISELALDVFKLQLTAMSLGETLIDGDLGELKRKLESKFEDGAEEVAGADVQQLIAEHFYMYQLNIGNPGPYGQRPSPEMIAAMQTGVDDLTGYVDQQGLETERGDIANYYNLYFKRRGADMPDDFLTARDVIIGSGASEVIRFLINGTLEGEDNAVGTKPLYPLYSAIMGSLGQELRGTTLTVEGEGDEAVWKLNIGDLEAQINCHTKVMFLNSPNNPTAAIFSREEIEGAMRIAKKHGLMVISDEIYAEDCYGSDAEDRFTSAGDVAYQMGVPTVVISGISKGMGKAAGWRIGWGVLIDKGGDVRPIWDAICGKSAGARLCINGPAQKAIDPLIKDFTKLEERRIEADQLDVDTSDLATIQHLAADKIKTAAQRDSSMQAFNQGRLSVPNSQATYYGMFKVEGITDVETEARFAKELFKKYRVRIVPGTGFQYPTPGYYRLVFLDNQDNMRKAGDIVRLFADEFLGSE